ncbi:hypothetical protein SAMN04488544_3503 [Microlunatus sagamiharensis]|uniref:FtsX-like permease family protein n=1 Tax=Microlunatus sagamiharensis TaxID=546874 RepID=A0A1H2N7Z1_9ACTN|nr:hypothetical protein [Microlunatus sagamiharensis]SDV01590.1 hypothetical protein SAMN04488544_3503 [Microlunatus sagamiharensis]
MTTTTSPRTPVPARRLQVLSTCWLPGAVLSGLVALGALGLAASGLVGILGEGEPGRPLTADVVGLVVGAPAAVVLGMITWRLAVDVPRDLRAWRSALDERREVQGG